MIRSRLGPGMVVSDVRVLDNMISEAVLIVGRNYSYVLDYVCTKIMNGEYSSALKANAIKKSSWFRMHIQNMLDVM